MVRRSAAGVFALAPPSPLPHPAELVVAALEPVALPERVARIERAVAARLTSVVAVVESLADPHNAAAILRTCDGLGVHEVHAIERDATVLITRAVTKSVEKWMDLRRHDDPVACARELKARGYKVFVADMRAARPIEDLAREPRVALAFGNEHQGVSDALREASDGAFAVPMRGMVESFNVSVAAGIALYEATRGRAGDLGGARALELKARFLMESVRAPEMIVERYVRDHAAGRR